MLDTFEVYGFEDNFAVDFDRAIFMYFLDFVGSQRLCESLRVFSPLRLGSSQEQIVTLLDGTVWSHIFAKCRFVSPLVFGGLLLVDLAKLL